MIVAGVNERLMREHNDRMSQAWHTAALYRAKRLPKLKTLFAKAATRRRQDWREQLAIMDQWVAYTAKRQRINGRTG